MIVTDANGCSVTGTTSLTVNENPSIDVVSNDGPVCEGGTVNLSVSVSGGTGPYSYSWSGPNGFSSSDQNPIISNITLADAGDYEVVVTDANGCGSTTGSTTVVVNENPVIDNIFNDGPVCAGGTLNLSVVVSGGTGPYTYLWTGPDGFTSSDQNPIIANVTVANAGDYEVVVTDANGCGSAIGSTTAVVNDNPVIDDITNNGPVCVGGELNLSVTVSGGSGPYSFSWTGPDGFTSTDENPIISGVTIANAGTYDVIVTDINGCGSATGSTSVVVNENPTIDDISNNGPVCEGTNLELSSTVSGGIGPYTYSWSGPNGFVSNDEDPVISTPTSDYSGNYELLVSDANGCSTTQSTNVVVNDLPVVILNDVSTCYGQDVALTAITSGGSGNYVNYTWYDGSGAEISNDPSNQYLLTGTDVELANSGASYSVVVEDDLGCFSLADTAQLTVNDIPTVDFISNDGPVCAGDDLNLSVDASGSSPLSYLWSGPNGYTTSDEDPTLVSVSDSNEGEYFVTITDDNGCSLDTSTTVVVSSLVIDDVSNSGPVFEGEDVTLSVTVSGGIEPYTYTWSGSDGFSSSDQNPTITGVTLANAGEYVVDVTDANGCNISGTTEVIVLENVGIPEVVVTDSSYCEDASGAVVEVINPQNNVTYEIVYEDGTSTSYTSIVYDGAISIVWNNVTGGAAPTGTTYRVKSYRAELPSDFQESDPFTIREYALPTKDTMTVNGSMVPVPGGLTESDCSSGTGYKIGLENSWGYYEYRLILDGSVLETKTGGVVPFVFDSAYSYVGTYTIEAQSDFGCTNSMAGSFTIEGDELQKFDLSAENNGRYCEDDPDGVELSLSGSENGVEYIVLQDGTPFDTITGDGNALVLGNYQQAGSDTTIYSVVAYSSGGCPYLMNNRVDVVEISLPDPGNLVVSNGGHFCDDGVDGVDITLEITQKDGVTYELFEVSSGTVIQSYSGIEGDGNISFVTGFNTEGTYQVRAVTYGVGCEAFSNEIVVVADPLPKPYPVIIFTEKCGPTGEAVIGLETTETDVEYRWKNSSGVGSWEPGTGSSIEFIVVDVDTYEIEARNVGTLCTSLMTGNADIQEHDLPDNTIEVASSGGAACDDGVIIEIPNPESDGYTYQVFTYNSGGEKVYGQELIVPDPVTPLAFDPIVDLNSTYYVEATSEYGCPTVLDDNVNVDVAGAVKKYYLEPEEGDICNGEPGIEFELEGSDIGVDYALVHAPTNDTIQIVAGTGNDISFDLVNEEGEYYVVGLSPSDETCNNEMLNRVELKVRPLPIAFNMIGPGAFCDGSGAVLGIDNSEAGVSYMLQRHTASGKINVQTIVAPTSGDTIQFNRVSDEDYYSIVAISPYGCTSSMKDSIHVVHMPDPNVPVLANDTVFFCSSEPYGMVQILGAEANVTYRLVDNTNNIAAEAVAESAGDLDLGPVFEGSYLVSASYEGACVTSLSDSVRLIEVMQPVPNIPQLDPDVATVCYGNSVKIIYDISEDDPLWYYDIVDGNDGHENVILSEADGVKVEGDNISWDIDASGTYYIRISTKGNICEAEYGKIDIAVSSAIVPPNISSDEILYCPESTDLATIIVGNTSAAYGYYLYRSDDTSNYLKRQFGESGFVSFENMGEGDYVIQAVDLVSGCFSEFDTVTIGTYPTPPVGEMKEIISNLGVASEKTEYLSDEGLKIDVIVSALYSDMEYFLVNENTGTSVQLNPSETSVVVTEPGDYKLYVRYSSGLCEPVVYNGVLHVLNDMFEADSAYIYLNEGEVSDTVTVKVRNQASIDVGNLSFFFAVNGSTYYEDEFGEITIDASTGLVEFTKSPSFFGGDTIVYRVENIVEPSRWDQDTIFVYVGNKDITKDRSIFIPNAFSPNGDGLNDYFVISSNRSTTEESTLEVFNRWGTLVYRSKGKIYENDWDGKSNNSNMVSIGNDLPNGVYFYVYTIRANVEDKTVIKKFNGFVELRR
ncbi:gliding motility-associated C-terminal domain-containing protein [Thermophagus sp. OGC60D27]|uniref:T9SS type B sorting domain-containing protein n=1 Tax=Thermophagus sp. OGC60D27 TaxID=3458415 RepID=UPI004037C17A